VSGSVLFASICHVFPAEAGYQSGLLPLNHSRKRLESSMPLREPDRSRYPDAKCATLAFAAGASTKREMS
jgi:hypothetical protein